MELNHLAIIMDGNRRWALLNNRPSYEGHRFGADNLWKVIKDIDNYSINYLTLFVFSTENWKRSESEVVGLMSLFKKFINKKLLEVSRNGKGAYNTLTETDILNIKIYDSEMKEFTDMLLTEDYINKKQMFQEGYEMNKISEHKILNSFGGF